MNRHALKQAASVLVFLLAVTIGLLASVEPAVSAAEPPNFIFFITDDISWNDLGCYGNNPTNDRQDPQGRRNPDYHRGTFPGAEQQATSINHPGPVTK